MTDYFISNEADDIGGVEDTTAGRFPPQETRAILLTQGKAHAVALPPINEIWVSFYEYLENANATTAEDGLLHELWTSVYQLFGIRFVDGNATQYRINRTATTGFGGNYPMGALHKHDVQILQNIGGVVDNYRIVWYVDGALLFDTTEVTESLKNGSHFREWNFGGFNYLGGADRHWVSNLLISDIDTRNREFVTIKPTSAGDYSQWIGGLSELSDGDLTTHARSDAGGERVSLGFTAPADPGGTITSITVVADVQASGASPNPSQIAPFLRIGTVDYDGAATVLNSPARQSVNVAWGTDPSDAAAWTWADLTGLEFGLLSVT